MCISRHGEFGSHTPDPLHTCTLCGVLDEDALLAELAAARAVADTTPAAALPYPIRSGAGIRAEGRRGLAAEIKAWRDKNDFARSPDWWQATDEILDIIGHAE